MMAKSKRARSTEAIAVPPDGVLVGPRTADFNQAFTHELTPARVKSILRAAADGEPAEQNAVFNELLEKDLDLRNAKRTRLMALTGLPWEIISSTQATQDGGQNDALADECTAYCREVCQTIEGFDKALRHLDESIARGCSLVEIEWATVDGQRRPIAAHCVSPTRLREDWRDPGKLRALSGENDHEGIDLSEFPAGKFIVWPSDPIGHSHFRGGLLRACVVAALVKRLGLRAWQTGVELFGLPITIGKYRTSATAEEKAAIKKMLSELGIARGGMFPEGTEIELKEAGQAGAWPHERLLSWVEAGYAKLWLGQTLTTQVGETGGAMATATVHNEVRADLRDDDIRAEAEVIREQLLRPLVLLRFGERARWVVPHFRRIIEEPVDDALVLSKIDGAVNKLGLSVPIRFAVEELGIAVVDGTDLDAPIPGAPAGLDPFGLGGVPAGTAPPATDAVANRQLRATQNRTRLLANRLLTTIAKRRSPLASIVPWMALAVTASMAHTDNVLAVVAAAIASKSDVASASAALADSFAGLPIDDLVELNRQSLLATELFGRAVQFERIARRGGRNHGRDARATPHATRLVANAGSIDFARLPFEEAISALRDRIGLDPRQFENLDREARSRAFRVAGVWNMELLSTVHEELVSALASGTTPRDFRESLPEMADRRGWSGENPWHADLVFFQNTAMAYAAGAHRQHVEAGVPAWRFVTNGESCPICEPQQGKVYRIGDTDRIPPLHFNCDCDQEPVFEEELGGFELNDSAREPNPALESSRNPEGNPDSGFKFDVREYGSLAPLDLSRFPLELRAAFRSLAAANGWQIKGE